MARNLRDGGEKGDMKKFLETWQPYIILVFMVSCVFIWQRLLVYRQIMQESLELSRTINSRFGIDTTSSIDSLKNLVIDLQMENQSHTSSIEIYSNYIVLFITLLFGIFFTVGYGVFDIKVDQIKKENIESLKFINEAHAKHERQFNELKMFFLKSEGNTSVLLADFCNKNGFIIDAIKFKILAAECFRGSFEMKVGNEPVNYTVIKHNLDEAYISLKSFEFSLENLSQENIISLKDKLTSVMKYLGKLILMDDLEISNMATKIKVALIELQERISA